MAVREVLRMGHPTLRVKAEPVSIDELKSAEFKQLIQDMFETMEEEDGIGIAAPQIGVSKQVAIVGIPNENPRYPEVESDDQHEDEFEVLVVVNPTITVIDSELSGFWEACLSVPGLKGYVERPKAVRVDYTDLAGKAQTYEAKGFAAIVFQHELDHLDGTLYVDKVTDKTKLSFMDEYLEFVEEVESEEE